MGIGREGIWVGEVVDAVGTRGIAEIGGTIGGMTDVTTDETSEQWEAEMTDVCMELAAEAEWEEAMTAAEEDEVDATLTVTSDLRRDVTAATDETVGKSQPTAYRLQPHSPPPHRHQRHQMQRQRQQSRGRGCNFNPVLSLHRPLQQPTQPGHPYSERPSPERRCWHRDPKMRHQLLLQPLPLLPPLRFPHQPRRRPLRRPLLLPPLPPPLPTARPPPAALPLLHSLLVSSPRLCAVHPPHRWVCAS